MIRIPALATALLMAAALPAAAQSTDAGSTETADRGSLGPAVFLSIDGKEAFRVSDWLGAPVRLQEGDDEIGEVESLLLDRDGKTVAVIIGVGGFLGIGEKDIAVDIGTINARREEDGVILELQATREQVNDADPVILED